MEERIYARLLPIEDASLDLETGLNSIDAVRARDPMNPVKGFIKA